MSSEGDPRLAIVIPTRDRRDILLRTLAGLGKLGPEAGVELIVVDDGSSEENRSAIKAIEFPADWRVAVIEREAAGPAAARNAGVAAARAPAVLFLGDDSLPTPGLIESHLDFHARHPEPQWAMLGLVRPCPPLDRVKLQTWLHEEGTQFGYARLQPGTLVEPTCFWTSNVSVKRELLIESGGFDESFSDAACEDAELGLRLARHGMQLIYDDDALALHFHPTDLSRTLSRMARVGVAYRRLVELAPEMAAPNRPGARHRLKAAALELRCRLVPDSAADASTWRFLCDEALREAYWSADKAPSRGDFDIGGRLARMAVGRPEANPPLYVAPAATAGEPG